MSNQHDDIVNFDRFVTQFMGANSDKFGFRAGAIQIYPLSIASSSIVTPSPLFRADYNFLLLLSEGGGKQQIDNEIFDLNPNDVLFIREGHLNAIKLIRPDTDGYFIYIDSTLLPQIFSDNALLHRLTFHPRHSVSRSDMEWICQCCELLLRQKTDTPSVQEIQVVLLRAIILKLAEASAAARSKPDRQSEITMLFKELLYKNFSKYRDVAFYADSMAVSENYLNRCVNRVTNKPPKQHINEMVIVHSKVLLQNRSKDIAQVAFELNFSDPSYFSRLFKQFTRQTPTEYKNTFMQDLSG
jgi:AraC-like DNA-binding protein